MICLTNVDSNNPYGFKNKVIGGANTDYEANLYCNGFKITDYTEADENAPYYIGLPLKSGTIALTSDIPTEMSWTDITGKPTFATVATTGAYTDLSGKPTIGNATLTIQKNGTSIGTFTANATISKSIDITVPTKTSDITNDSGFITSSAIPTNYVTTDTAQTITESKTFENYVTCFGNNFRIRQPSSGTGNSIRPTVTLMNANDEEVGFLQYHPTNNQIVYGANEKNSSGIQVALRQYNSSNAYSALLPTTANKYSNIGSGDVTFPLGIKVGSAGTVLKANNGGLIELPSETWTFEVDDGQGGTTTVTKTIVLE